MGPTAILTAPNGTVMGFDWDFMCINPPQKKPKNISRMVVRWCFPPILFRFFTSFGPFLWAFEACGFQKRDGIDGIFVMIFEYYCSMGVSWRRHWDLPFGEKSHSCGNKVLCGSENRYDVVDPKSSYERKKGCWKLINISHFGWLSVSMFEF